MNCRRIEDRLQMLVEGGLSGPGLAEVERHLANCQACVKKLSELRRLDSVLSGEPLVDPPRDLAGDVVRKALLRRRWQPRAFPLSLELATQAGLALVIVGVAYVGSEVLKAALSLGTPATIGIAVVAIALVLLLCEDALP